MPRIAVSCAAESFSTPESFGVSIATGPPCSEASSRQSVPPESDRTTCIGKTCVGVVQS